MNSRIEAAWERDAIGRPVRSAFDTLSSAARLARVGTRLVVDGPLAACLQGAPVGEPVERIWCDPAHAEQLRAASVRIHRDFRPVWRRDHGDDCSLSEGDQVDIGDCRVTLGPLPPAVWAVDMFGEALPVVGVDTLLGYPHWTPAERVAVRRLAAMLAEHGEASHGLDPVDTPR